jgi:Protein of unknown function (DUF2799)
MNNHAPPGLKFLAALLVLALPGCATMNKSECLNVDWRTIGYEDGVAGRSGDRIAQHRKACAKHGVVPNLDAYQSGREQGLREYCQPDNGYQLGSSGATYVASCPADLKQGFESAYHSGFELYTLRARVANATSELEASRQELAQSEKDLVAISAVVLDRSTDNTARAQALLDAKNNAERQGQLKARIRQLEKDRYTYQRDLDNYLTFTGGGR